MYRGTKLYHRYHTLSYHTHPHEKRLTVPVVSTWKLEQYSMVTTGPMSVQENKSPHKLRISHSYRNAKKGDIANIISI